MLFTILIGISGSGKSTWAEMNAEANTVILSSDAIRKELWGSEEDQHDPAAVFAEMNMRAKQYVGIGLNVIYDATNLNRKKRIALINDMKKVNSNIIFKAVVFATPIPFCIERRANPKVRQVPAEVIMRQVSSFQPPYYDEGFTEICLIKPAADICNDYLLDCFHNCNNTKHDTPFHKDEYISEHLTKVRNNLFLTNGNEAVIGLLHDLGKPIVKTWDKQKKIAHYCGHEYVSAYLALFLNNEKEYVLRFSYVISLHMRKFSFNNEIKYNQWLHSLPLGIQKLLIKLNEADEKDSIKI